MGQTTAPSLLGNHAPKAAPSPIHRVFGAIPFHTDGTPVGLAFLADGGLGSIEEPGVLRLEEIDDNLNGGHSPVGCEIPHLA